MAKIKLDFAALQNCRLRQACTVEDIQQAESCLKYFESEFFSLKMEDRTARLLARYYLTFAELMYRKGQILKGFEALQCINAAVHFLEDAIECVGSAEYEEKTISRDFKKFLIRYYIPKSSRRFFSCSTSDENSEA